MAVSIRRASNLLNPEIRAFSKFRYLWNCRVDVKNDGIVNLMSILLKNAENTYLRPKEKKKKKETKYTDGAVAKISFQRMEFNESYRSAKQRLKKLRILQTPRILFLFDIIYIIYYIHVYNTINPLHSYIECD